MDANTNAPYERSTYNFDAEYAIARGGDKPMYHATLRDPRGKYSTKTFHVSTKSTMGKYPCIENWPHSNERCPASYATPSLLKEHIALLHNRQPILCNLCPRILGDKSGAETHAKLHLEGSRYQCPMCTYRTQRRDNVLRHIKTQHRAEGAEPVDLKRTLGGHLPPRTQKRRRQTNDDAAAMLGPQPKCQQGAQAVDNTARLIDLDAILPRALPQESTSSHVNINSPEAMFYNKPFHVWEDELLNSDPFLTDPFLADPFLTDPFLTDPFLTDPFLTDPFLTDPFLTT
ncbi:hypothetical protein DV736_g2945, partial [Chaetothyriales sp. CBS 134916]